jgi:hypothetical protein
LRSICSMSARGFVCKEGWLPYQDDQSNASMGFHGELKHLALLIRNDYHFQIPDLTLIFLLDSYCLINEPSIDKYD